MSNPKDLHVPTLIRNILRSTGWTQKKLAAELPSSQGSISKWVSGLHSPSFDEWRKIDALLSRLEGTGLSLKTLGRPATMPVSGKVGAGSIVYPIEGDTVGEGYDEVEIPPMFDEYTQAAVVAGDSQYPRYFDGEVIYYKYPPERPPADYIGRECIVKLETGEMMLKTLRKGSTLKTFHLESWNAPLMEDRYVEWASPVEWTKRRS